MAEKGPYPGCSEKGVRGTYHVFNVRDKDPVVAQHLIESVGLAFDILGGRDNLSLLIDAKDFIHENRIYVDKSQRYDCLVKVRESDFWGFKYGEIGRYCYGLEIEYRIDYIKKVSRLLLTKDKYTHQDIIPFSGRYEVIPEERVELLTYLDYRWGPIMDIEKYRNLIRTTVEEAIGISLDPFGQETY